MGLEVIPLSVRVVVIAPTASFHCSRLRRVHCSLVHVSQRFFGRRQSLQSLILMVVFVAVVHPVRGLPRACLPLHLLQLWPDVRARREHVSMM